jgi:uncharacterized membrane protein HdeD (DUF308 family)
MASKSGGAMGTLWAHDWWVVLLRGIVAVLFGLLAFFLPSVTLIVLVLLFGIFAIVDGILSFERAFSASSRNESWIWPTIVGVLGIAAGVAAFIWPGITALVLLYIIAAWALLTGIVEIIGTIRMRREISDEWLFVLGGVLSVLFGLLVFARPGVGAIAVVWLIGFYAIVLGIQRIAVAFRMRDWQEHPTSGGAPQMPHAA